MFFFLRSLCLLLLSSTATAFVQEFLAKTQQPPLLRKNELDTNTNALVGIPLDMNLEIGQEKDNIFSVRNLAVNLNANPPATTTTTTTTTPMPDQPALSAHITSTGHYVNRQGLQTLDIDPASACWQLIWREQAPAGNCVVGLDVRTAATRNQAHVDAGALFVSFPVWQQDRLTDLQTQKAHCEMAARVHLQARDEEIAKMKESSNVLAKAWHYRNALAAVEKYHLQPIRSMAAIPNQEDVIAISDTLFLARMGTIWKKQDKGFGLHSNLYMGTASLKTPLTTNAVVEPSTLLHPDSTTIAP